MLQDDNVSIDEVNGRIFTEKGVNLFIKREDKIHEKISGNKWRKLKYNISHAKNNGYEKLISLGGPYSNHIVALAAASKIYNFKSIGLIRGEHDPSNPSLIYAEACGMELQFVDRTAFKSYREDNFKIQSQFPEHYFIPEGGSNSLGINGCTEIINDLKIDDYDYYCVPIGTGGTICGMIKGLKGSKKVLGFSSLKGNFVHGMIRDLLKTENIQETNYTILDEFHFGGYAKYNTELIDYINDFKKVYNIQLDPIYTGKMLFGIYKLIGRNYFAPKTKILAIHTGGLQGIEGFNQRYGGLLKV